MDFSKVEAEFQRLKRQFEAGALTEAEFKAQLQNLMIQDEQGRWWMIGYETGQWYYHDGTKWVRGEPPQVAVLAPSIPLIEKPTEAQRVPTLPGIKPLWIGGGLGALVLLAVLVVALARLGGPGGFAGSTPKATEPAAVAVIEPTATTRSVIPPAPTPVPPTAMPVPPTSTPVPPTATSVPPTSTPLPGVVTVPLEKLAQANPWLPLDKNAVPGTFYYGFNVNKSPFDNRLVRQAFAAAVDRRVIAELANTLGTKNARPATTFTPPETLGRYLYGQIGIAFDPAKARALLVQAGYPKGQGFPAVTLVTNKAGGGTSGANVQIADAVVAMWREHLEVDVKVEVVDDWQAYRDRLARDAPALYRLGWGADFNDPDNFLKEVMHSGSTHNYGHFSNAEFDRLVERAATLSDPATRQALYIQGERILCEDQAAVIPLYHATYQLP
jgi:oligopeptide transport system substrate-binding protein